jgi:uncharacterized protein (DUF697 family)
MANPLKIASLWRVIRDVDLEGLRRSAQARFALAVVSETGDDAARVRQILTGPDAPPHPWIEVAPVAPDALSALSSAALVGLLVTRDADLSPGLKLAGNRFAAAGTPVLTVAVGDVSPTARVLRPGERARVAVDALDAAAVEPIGNVLLSLVTEDQQIALAAHFPPLRPAVFSRTIERTARANASFALTTGLAETIPVLTAPLNLGDIVVLTKNQLMMCFRLALAAGRDDDARAMMGEIIGVLGGGVLFRQVARQLVGLIPIAGILPKVAIAYAGTYAIGRAMVAWTTEGRQVTVDTVSGYTREGMARGRTIAQNLLEDAAATGGRTVRRLDRFRRFLPGKRTKAQGVTAMDPTSATRDPQSKE